MKPAPVREQASGRHRAYHLDPEPLLAVGAGRHRLGGRPPFHMDMPGWGQVPCEEPEARLVHTFDEVWTLRWTLVAEGRSTRLLLEHAGVELDAPQGRSAHEHIGPRWRDEVLPRLAALLAPAPA